MLMIATATALTAFDRRGRLNNVSRQRGSNGTDLTLLDPENDRGSGGGNVHQMQNIHADLLASLSSLTTSRLLLRHDVLSW